MSAIRQEAPPASAHRATGSRPVRSLAVVEASRLIRHPLVLGTMALCCVLWIYQTAVTHDTAFPVLHDQDRYLQTQLLILAAGVFLGTHIAVLRSARDETEPWFALMVLTPWQRTAAHLLAVLPVAGLAALLVTVRIVWLALLPGAIGSPSPAELATSPAVVLLAGTLAVLTGTLVRAVAAGPLILGVAAIATVAGGIADSSSWRWLLPTAEEDDMRTALPAHLLDRPAGPHLVYVLLLVAVCAVGALLRAGMASAAVRTAGVLALVGAVSVGALQLQHARDGAAEAQALDSPSRQQRCAEEGGVRYCAYPDFTDRREQWAPVARAILAPLPVEARNARYVVRQHISPDTGPLVVLDVAGMLRKWALDDRRAGTPGAVVVGTHWGDHSDQGSDATAGFATEFAHRAVAGEGAALDAASPSGTVRACGARAVVSVWLAGQAAPMTERALRSVLGRSGGDVVGFAGTLSTTEFGRMETDLGMALLDRPRDDVARGVRRSWDELTAAATTARRAAELLGVPVPAGSGKGCAS